MIDQALIGPCERALLSEQAYQKRRRQKTPGDSSIVQPNMLSHSIVIEPPEYDVICIGNYAAIIADHICSTQTHKYKFALLHLESELKQQYQSSLGSTSIAVRTPPNGIDVIQKRIQQIIPTDKTILLEDGERIAYRFLVYGENEWTAHWKQHPLAEALQTEYSRVYSNLDERKIQLSQNEGKMIFYVPAGPGSFRHKYPFFQVLDKIQDKSKTQICIFVEGNSLFPDCPKAHELLEQRLIQEQVKIVYRVTIKDVDFLRRVLFYEKDKEKLQIPYETVFCFIPEKTPKLLLDAGIEPFNCSKRLLHNNNYENIYVIGANTLPTTQSFHSLSMQIHHISKNLYERLLAQDLQRKALLSCYDGSTRFYLQLGLKDVVQIRHGYKGKDYRVKEVSCWWESIRECWMDFMVRQFFNYDSFGPPHYLWEPTLPSTEKWLDKTEHPERDQIWKISQLSLQINNKSRKTT